MVPIIVLTNGRPDCISKTISSALGHLHGASSMVIVDDSGDPTYGQWLEDEFIGGPWDGKVMHLPEPHGYWRAMQYVWALARTFTARHWMILEEDFTFNRDVDLRELARVLDEQDLQQIVLRRQPWFSNEHEHGGVIEARETQGGQFFDRSDGVHHWIEHRDHWSMNPAILRVELCKSRPWPAGAWSESRFGREVLRDPDAKLAYWGKRSDSPWVTHVGARRVGSDY